MDGRKRHASVSRLALVAIPAAAGGLAAVKGRSQARAGLRMLGLWAYLSVVNGGGPNARLAREACHACPDDDAVTPYWGHEPRRSTEYTSPPSRDPLAEPRQ